MVIILVILYLVGAMAGSSLPTEKTARSATQTTMPVVSAQPTSSVARNPSCDAHPRYRDLSVSTAARSSQSTIELCHGP